MLGRGQLTNRSVARPSALTAEESRTHPSAPLRVPVDEHDAAPDSGHRQGTHNRAPAGADCFHHARRPLKNQSCTLRSAAETPARAHNRPNLNRLERRRTEGSSTYETGAEASGSTCAVELRPRNSSLL